jgi:hypothetical protein
MVYSHADPSLFSFYIINTIGDCLASFFVHNIMNQGFQRLPFSHPFLAFIGIRHCAEIT